MATVRICDLDQRRVLAVDLGHLLDLLAPRSLRAVWVVSKVKSSGHEWFEATGPGAKQLETLAETGATLSGADLAALAKETHQIIWGEFAGAFSQTENTAWVTIRFIDSSFCVVTTADQSIIDKMATSYKDVREDNIPIR
jgi:hypothetical protein